MDYNKRATIIGEGEVVEIGNGWAFWIGMIHAANYGEEKLRLAKGRYKEDPAKDEVPISQANKINFKRRSDVETVIDLLQRHVNDLPAEV